MKGFSAFFRKEFTYQLRSGKLFGMAAVFILFAILSPATAKLMPKLLDSLGGSGSGAAFTVTIGEVTAFHSWQQFFNNISTSLIVFVLMQSGCFTNEYRSGTLVLALTKGLSRGKVLAAKGLMLILLWTGLYWVSFGICCGYTGVYWQSGAENVFTAALYWWVYGLFFTVLTVFFSAFLNGMAGVLAAVGGTLVVYRLLSMIPKLAPYLPTKLSEAEPLLLGEAVPGDYVTALMITAAVIAAAAIASKPLFDRKTI